LPLLPAAALNTLQVHFTEVLHALASRVAGTDVPQDEEIKVHLELYAKLPPQEGELPKYTAAHFYAALHVQAAVRGFLARHNMVAALQQAAGGGSASGGGVSLGAAGRGWGAAGEGAGGAGRGWEQGAAEGWRGRAEQQAQHVEQQEGQHEEQRSRPQQGQEGQQEGLQQEGQHCAPAPTVQSNVRAALPQPLQSLHAGRLPPALHRQGSLPAAPSDQQQQGQQPGRRPSSGHQLPRLDPHNTAAAVGGDGGTAACSTTTGQLHPAAHHGMQQYSSRASAGR
jgi:hypothetical protein